MKRKALIIGSRGQDGTLLTNFLNKHSYHVIGVHRHGVDGIESANRWSDLLQNKEALQNLLSETQPDEIYYLAAHHHSSEQVQNNLLQEYLQSHQVNTEPVIWLLEAMRSYHKESRFFYASSCHIYRASECLLNEESKLEPASPYALTKASAMLAIRYYRQEFGLFAVSGILFNHESSLRPGHFLSKKIISAAKNIHSGKQTKLEVGDLSAIIDWGYAPDFIEAMNLILQQKKPDDFVIATGIGYSVRDFIETAFSQLGLNWQDYVVENPHIIQRKPGRRIGDASKLKKLTGWQPKTDFSALISFMLKQENQ